MKTEDEFPDDVYERVKKLSARGDDLSQQGRFEEAIESYETALDLLPEPIEKWEAATWLYAAVGDAYFLSDDMEPALQAFESALQSAGGFGNPFLHKRRGQALFNLGRRREAANELTRAYALEGEEIFEQEHPKYLNFLESVLRKPTSETQMKKPWWRFGEGRSKLRI